MSITTYKRLTVSLGIVGVGLLILSGCLLWSYGSLKIHVAFAHEQTQIFEQMRTQALQSDATGAADCLAYVVNYYPSGSKQETGSRLDSVVERERVFAERDIIAYLHAKTGQNLGESPEAWIQRYAKK